MKIIIAGGRDFIPEIKHKLWIKLVLQDLKCSGIVSGNAKGADQFGEEIAKELNMPLKIFKADWKTYGPSAGPIRNGLMADYADACILFPGGKGTANMKSQALEKGLFVVLYKEENYED